MNNEQILLQRIERLEQIINALVRPDRYQFDKTIQTFTGGKIGFFGATPVIRQTSTGLTGNMGVVGGAAVTESNIFYGNGVTGYTIGDVVRHLKAYGLLPD